MNTLLINIEHLFAYSVNHLLKSSVCIFCLFTAFKVYADTSVTSLADLSLEELAALPVISVSKSAKPVADATASIFVITNRDIHNAGATTLPEALRLAPNLQVARVDARNYSVTARGFNNPFQNKLLVMIDGRTVYSPLFSGVYWDAQDVVLEDIERIEVVSGAGGTLWGANAVNGVVNIVSRSSAETQGELLSVGGGPNEQHASARYGGSLVGDGHYRVYVKRAEHDDTQTANGISTNTGYGRTQAGFRMDWGQGADAVTAQGDVYSGRLHQTGTADIEITGANVLARSGWQLSSGSTLTLQAYIDHTTRDQPNAFAQEMNTFDIELQHELALGSYQNIVWGAGYRYITDRIDNDQNFAFLPADINMSWKNVFIQDEISLAENVKLTVGSKWEDNPYTGVEAMPGVQLGWEPDETKLVWTSLSRAVRSPSRIDRDLYSPTNPAIVNGVPQYAVNGGPDFISEVAKVFDVGYRSQPVERVSWSITGFYSEYEKLRTLELNSNGPGLVFKNMAEADTYGVEMWGSWQVFSDWRLHGGLVAQKLKVSLKPGSADFTNTTGLANGDPDYYWLLRSTYDILDRVKFNAAVRHVDQISGFKLPSYTAFDMNVAWTVMPHVELSLSGQNLLGGAHAEFGNAPGRSEYERALFAKIVWGL
ncbi:MAG: TonB-dependent receptor [Cellvibrio sp.]|uniref:TonB-dependent receptor plug domain-containing protein n=1 Tax=Cellvibrio sp. TaxID=1965322 RepID=UPI0027248F78|nr:TonB-dependent receptor [Cellvibrio sp.]